MCEVIIHPILSLLSVGVYMNITLSYFFALFNLYLTCTPSLPPLCFICIAHVQAGIDLNRYDDQGLTPLMLAASQVGSDRVCIYV